MHKFKESSKALNATQERKHFAVDTGVLGAAMKTKNLEVCQV